MMKVEHLDDFNETITNPFIEYLRAEIKLLFFLFKFSKTHTSHLNILEAIEPYGGRFILRNDTHGLYCRLRPFTFMCWIHLSFLLLYGVICYMCDHLTI